MKHMNILSDEPCPVCNSLNLHVFFEVSDVPVNCNILWKSKDEAINCPKGDIKLAFCTICGFITNLSFEPERQEYNQLYENSLFFSPRFQQFAKSLSTRLIQHYGLNNKKIIEIGCGKGDFLPLLCELGDNYGVCFDPTYNEAREEHSTVEKRVKYIKDFYSKYYKKFQADLIFSWHVFEHINNPKTFLCELRKAIEDPLKTNIFFGVPNSVDNFKNLFVWDIIYEHVSYFTPPSLEFVFSSCGFKVNELIEEQGGQSLCVYAIPDSQHIINLKKINDIKSEVQNISKYIKYFNVNYQKKVETCREKLNQIKNKGQHAVVWGAGSRGVTFLNTMKDFEIEYAVDINPRKQGMYIPGTGQKIVSPTSLCEYQPDWIIIMNPLYQNEIRSFVNSLKIKTKYILV